MGAKGTNADKINEMIDKIRKIAPGGFSLALLVLCFKAVVRFIHSCYLCFPFFNQISTFGKMKLSIQRHQTAREGRPVTANISRSIV